MTAINLLVKDHASFLVTDSAYYDANGTCVEMRSKVATADNLRVAITGSGMVKDTHIARQLGTVSSQRQALDRLPDVVETIRADNIIEAGRRGGRESPELMLFVAMWSDERHRAEGYVISTDRSYLGELYTPGTLLDVLQLTSPPLPTIDLARFNLDTATGLLEAQRRWTSANDDHCYVGGFGEITVVSPAGVLKQRICEWPDRIGKRINEDG